MYIKKIDLQEESKDQDEEEEVQLSEELQIKKSIAQAQQRESKMLEESISMLERTSTKLYPVVREVIKRMIGEKGENFEDSPGKFMVDLNSKHLLSEEADMRSVLGFLN